MTRRLTQDERALWERLRADGEAAEAEGGEAAARSVPTASPKAVREKTSHRNAKARPASGGHADAASPWLPALAPFEEKTLRRLRRGLVAIDARIDLHGMRQERAHAALAAFLRHEQARGAQIVLVVTGKGGAREAMGAACFAKASRRWLADADFRHLVVGFEEAHRRHGGAGALYVRIRRRRAGAPRSMREA